MGQGIKDIIIKEKFEHTGIFSFDAAYAYAYNWFKDESFKVIEEKYKEKLVGTSEKEIEFEWTCTKRISDYFKEEIRIKQKTERMSEVEVEIDGKKKKTNKGKMEMEIKGTLISDPDSKWDASPWYTFLRDVYSKYVISGRVDKMEDEVEDDVIDFKEKMKEFLEITGKR